MKIADAIKALAAGVSTIRTIVDNRHLRTADDIFAALTSVLDDITALDNGDVTPDDCRDAWKALEMQLLSNDQRVDELIANKFPPKD